MLESYHHHHHSTQDTSIGTPESSIWMILINSPPFPVEVFCNTFGMSLWTSFNILEQGPLKLLQLIDPLRKFKIFDPPLYMNYVKVI